MNDHHGPGRKSPRPFSDPPAAGLLASEANHRITNNLALIVSLLHMQAREIRGREEAMAPEEVAQLLEDVGARIHTVAALHRLLSGTEAPDVDIGDYLRAVCAGLLSAFSYGGTVDLSGLEPGCILSSGRAVALALAVGELVTNAIKHGRGRAGRIALMARCEADGGVVVAVSDNGGGLPAGLDPVAEGGTGLRLVRTLGEQLQALLEFASNENGLRVSLRVPPAA